MLSYFFNLARLSLTFILTRLVQLFNLTRFFFYKRKPLYE